MGDFGYYLGMHLAVTLTLAFLYWCSRHWMMDNIFIRTDPAENIKADKEKSTEKIDSAVATIMGLDRAIHCGVNIGASIYDERGILFI